MSRNLVICFDGTNNRFGPENTNVIRLVQVLDRDPTRQRLYYDPGVGTLPRPELGKWRELLSRVPGLAFGAGLEKNVEEAYSYLMDMWMPGDRVFIYGFSRGAYTARVLAGLLHLLGLLPRGNQNMLPYVMELYRSIRGKHGRAHDEFEALCDDFRWTFARPSFEGDDARHFRVHFLGVWDTVSSVGWVWNPKTYHSTFRNPSIEVIRHALSIDERRWFFRQNQVEPTPGQDAEERWFAGVHSDVGGGYGEPDQQLWRLPFEWMLQESQIHGLTVDAARLAQIRRNQPAPADLWKACPHESLRGVWWIAEYVPKWRYSFATRKHRLAIGRGRRRFIKAGSRIDGSVLQRIRQTTYAPSNLTSTFVAQVRGLAESDVPADLATTDQPA